MKKNISIDNGNTYRNASELTAGEVIDVYDQIDLRQVSDEAKFAAEDASQDIDDPTEAKRAYIAKIAEINGEITLG